jgi:hypothetical protein
MTEPGRVHDLNPVFRSPFDTCNNDNNNTLLCLHKCDGDKVLVSIRQQHGLNVDLGRERRTELRNARRAAHAQKPRYVCAQGSVIEQHAA